MNFMAKAWTVILALWELCGIAPDLGVPPQEFPMGGDFGFHLCDKIPKRRKWFKDM